MSRRLPDNVLPLFHFIRRQKALSLYRQFFRLTNKLNDEEQKKEIRNWIRAEFVKMKNIDDKELIDMNLTKANDALRDLEKYLRQAHAIKD